MKKHILSLVLTVFLSGSFAQQIDIVSVDDMSTSLNGSEQSVSGSPSDVNIFKDMVIVNNDTEPVTLLIRRVQLANSGVLDQICYDDLLCVDATGETYTIPSEVTVQPGENTQFKPQIVPDNEEACVINKYEIITPFGIVMEEINVKFTSGTADCFLNTEEKLTIKTFEFYPNPAKESVKVEFDANEQATIQVLDALGKTVVNEKVSSGDKVAVNHLNNGVYFVQLTSDFGVVERKKLIIKR
jgi:hypothetical protein